MTTEHDFAAVLGPGRGSVPSHPHRYGKNHQAIERLLAHLRACHDKELLTLERVSNTALVGDFASAVAEADRITIRHYPDARDHVIDDLAAQLAGRFEPLNPKGRLREVVEGIALCMIAKCEISDDAVSCVRGILAYSDTRVDALLGQAELAEW